MDSPKKYRLNISYDGTSFSGWQVQPNSISIQGILEEALKTILRESIRVIGAGRTDAGVHARGQVAHFSTHTPFEPGALLRALNGMIPGEIRVNEIAAVHPDFHAQISAVSKEYHYHVWLDPVLDPFAMRYHYQFCYPHFNLENLKEAALAFIGTHDFATFANVGGKVRSTVRSLYRLDVCPQEGGIRLEFEGNGFLYKMVRNIVGTLLEVSIGKRKASDIPALLAAKDRRVAGVAAPPKGLCLVKTTYPENLLNSASKEIECTKGLPISETIFSSSV